MKALSKPLHLSLEGIGRDWISSRESTVALPTSEAREGSSYAEWSIVRDIFDRSSNHQLAEYAESLNFILASRGRHTPFLDENAWRNAFEELTSAVEATDLEAIRRHVLRRANPVELAKKLSEGARRARRKFGHDRIALFIDRDDQLVLEVSTPMHSSEALATYSEFLHEWWLSNFSNEEAVTLGLDFV